MTEQQALYVKGFEDALEDIKAKEQHHQNIHEEDSHVNHPQPIFLPDPTPSSSSASDAILTIEKATAAYTRTKQAQQRALLYPQQPPPLILAPISSGGDISRPSSGASGSLDSSIESHYLNSNVRPLKSNHTILGKGIYPFWSFIYMMFQITIKEEAEDSDFSSGQPSSRSRSRRKTSASSNNDIVSPINLESQVHSLLSSDFIISC